jgi:hypothetical protein
MKSLKIKFKDFNAVFVIVSIVVIMLGFIRLKLDESQDAWTWLVDELKSLYMHILIKKLKITF